VSARRRGNHPLVLAAGRGYKDVVSVLLSRIANVAGAVDRQAILDEAMVAAISSYSPTNDGLSTIRALVSAGASASSTSVLAGALSACDPELTKTFLAAGADPKKRYDLGRGGRLPVDYALQCFSRTGVPTSQVERMLSDLVSAGADLCPRELDQSEIPPAARSTVERLRTCH
jgi:ankyrin repeat protein